MLAFASLTSVHPAYFFAVLWCPPWWWWPLGVGVHFKGKRLWALIGKHPSVEKFRSSVPPLPGRPTRISGGEFGVTVRL